VILRLCDSYSITHQDFHWLGGEATQEVTMPTLALVLSWWRPFFTRSTNFCWFFQS